MVWILALWNRLISPSTQITDEAEQALARFFSALLLALMGLLSIYTVVVIFLAPDPLGAVFVLAAMSLVSVAYAVSRTRHFRAAIYGIIIALSIYLYFILAFGSDESYGTATFYFVLPVIMAGVMLSARALTIVTFLTISGVIIFMAFGPGSEYDHARGYLINSTLVILITAFFLNYRVQADRRQLVELSRSEERYRKLVHHVNDGIWDWAGDENVYYSPRYMQILGYGPYEFTHNSEEWEKRLHPDDKERVLAICKPVIDGDTDAFSVEYRLRHKDGNYRWILGRASNMRDEAGKVVRVIGTHTDITRRKQVQQQEIELALERKRTELLATFVTLSSHEFRTPLSIINSSAYMLSRCKDERKENYFNNIQAQVSHVTDLLNMLTLMAKLDILDKADAEDINLCHIASAISTSQHASLQERGIHFIVECTSPIIYHGDRTYLNHALTELVDNAIRFTPQGGTITMHINVRNQHIYIEVVDTGAGIREQELPQVFERFYRADKAGTTRGFGLGLPIVKKIVELHDGQIEIDSAPGEGTTVRIVLPQMRANNEHQTTTTALPTS